MKKDEKTKLRELTIPALVERLKKEQKEANLVKLKMSAGKVKDLHEYRKVRHKIAVIKTMLREKELTEIKKG